MQENLAAKVCLLLGDRATKAEQWKLLGQEKDGCLLLGWIENISVEKNSPYSVIGKYNRVKNDLQVLHRFSNVINLVQASINQSCTLLGYVIKQNFCSFEKNETNLDTSENNDADCNTKEKQNENSDLEYYQAYLIELKTEELKIYPMETKKLKQVRIQFLYREKTSSKYDRLLVLVHQEYVNIFTIIIDNDSKKNSIKEQKKDILIKTFIWAQWDAINQVLYHIHHRKSSISVFSEDTEKLNHKPPCSSPTLSGFQFHDDLPHETVLNIPLNLPQTPNSKNCGTYEDDVIPLRIHDCSLDLIVISDSKGAVCICHHYLYQSVQPPQNLINSGNNDSNTVHFAYSVTLLHHSCVIHCVIPGIPWTRAKLMKPTFTLYGEGHMLVFVQDFLTHLLEVGLHHQPCCHILSGPLTNIPPQSSYLVPLLNTNHSLESSDFKTKYSTLSESISSLHSSPTNILTIDLPTLNLVNLSVPSNFLVDVFKKETSTEVRLGILHYFLCHRNDMKIVTEIISAVAEKSRSLDIGRIMQEFLISGSHSLAQKNLASDIVPLLALVPVTTLDECSVFEAKINDFTVTLNHEKLLNTSVMLLSPQQRLVPYRSDLWTKLWDLLSKKSDEMSRFKPSHASEKLLVSLACYQPEVLSRCTTPMSPSGGFSPATFGDLLGGRHITGDSALPFIEMESCTASKQEHIVSVNLRELSLHLLKYGTQNTVGKLRPSCSPLHVHALSTRYVACQLETSRNLCQILCKVVNFGSKYDTERGFCLIDMLEDSKRWLLFTLLERYRYATERIAFPVPQGFMSFFTYLGYRTLKYSKFLQYIRHSVFELQVDVAKIIMADIGDTKANISRKLELLSLLPRTRAKRLLNQWHHPVSFMLRAREHSSNILSGELSQPSKRPAQHRYRHNGVPAFPSTDRLSPLDTFLDLLTAKANLAELDFGLLMEATSTSTEDIL